MQMTSPGSLHERRIRLSVWRDTSKFEGGLVKLDLVRHLFIFTLFLPSYLPLTHTGNRSKRCGWQSLKNACVLQ